MLSSRVLKMFLEEMGIRKTWWIPSYRLTLLAERFLVFFLSLQLQCYMSEKFICKCWWFYSPLQLCTRIIEKNANPEWNQKLNLQVKVTGSGSVEGKCSWSKLINLNHRHDGIWILVKSLISHSSPPCVNVLNWLSLIGKSDLNLMLAFQYYLWHIWMCCNKSWVISCSIANPVSLMWQPVAEQVPPFLNILPDPVGTV